MIYITDYKTKKLYGMAEKSDLIDDFPMFTPDDMTMRLNDGSVVRVHHLAFLIEDAVARNDTISLIDGALCLNDVCRLMDTDDFMNYSYDCIVLGTDSEGVFGLYTLSSDSLTGQPQQINVVANIAEYTAIGLAVESSVMYEHLEILNSLYDMCPLDGLTTAKMITKLTGVNRCFEYSGSGIKDVSPLLAINDIDRDTITKALLANIEVSE